MSQERFIEHDCPDCGEHYVADLHAAHQVAVALRIAGAFRCSLCATVGSLDEVGGIAYSAPTWIVVCSACTAGLHTAKIGVARP